MKATDEIRALLQAQRYGVLSTRERDGQPYASLVALWSSADLSQIVFCTSRTTRKFENLSADGRVALLVDSRSNRETDLQQAAAVTVLGRCAEAVGDERIALAERFVARHPALAEFVDSPACAVMRVDVRTYYLVTRFRDVVEHHVSSERPHGDSSEGRRERLLAHDDKGGE